MNTALVALEDLYKEASAATVNLQAALSKARQGIRQGKEEEAIRARIMADPSPTYGSITAHLATDPDPYTVLQDALNILDYATTDEERWKSGAAIPMLKILQSRIRQVLNKSQAGGSIQ